MAHSSNRALPGAWRFESFSRRFQTRYLTPCPEPDLLVSMTFAASTLRAMVPALTGEASRPFAYFLHSQDKQGTQRPENISGCGFSW